MTGYLYSYANESDEQTLARLLSQQPKDAWVYLEHDYPLHEPYAVYLKFLRDAKEPHRYSIGRIFNENFELRWQRSPYHRVSIQMLCEDKKYSQDNFIAVEEFDTDKNTAHIFLWGTYTEHLQNKHEFMVQKPAWFETRIPRPLEYPLRDEDKPAHVQLKTLHYYQRDTRSLRTTRWLALEKSGRKH